MSKGMVFWLLMILWLVLGLYVGWGAGVVLLGKDLLAFALIFLLGWHCFGFIVQ